MIGWTYIATMSIGWAKPGISKSPWCRIKGIDGSTKGNARLLIALPFLFPEAWEGVVLAITKPIAERPKVTGSSAGATEFRRLRLLGIPVPLFAPVICLGLLLALWGVQIALLVVPLAMWLVPGWTAVDLPFQGFALLKALGVLCCFIVAGWNVWASRYRRNPHRDFSALVAVLAGLAGWLIIETL